MTMRGPADILSAHPPYLHPDYASTRKRAPLRPLIHIPATLSELTGPVYGHEVVQEGDSDLTRQHAGEPLGERIIVSGRVLDEDGRPVPNTLVEIWQCNAAGRYVHVRDQHPAPLDANFHGGRPGGPPIRRDAIGSPRSSPAPIPGATTRTPGGRPISISRCSGRPS